MDRQGQNELIQPYDRQMRLGLELAVAELNAAGGILGRQVELLVADDEGSPAPGAAAAMDLIRNEGAEALVSGFVMAMPPYMDRTLEREGLDVPVVHAMQTPGIYCGRVAHVGSTTLQAISTLLEHRGPEARRRTFQISDWAPSQRTVSNQFYRHVQAGSTGAALVTTPVRGNSPGEYTGLVQWARDLDARNFWISIPRPYAVNVVTQADSLGVASDFAWHFLEFSEWQASQLPDGVEAWTSVPFVASEDRPGVPRLRGARPPACGGRSGHARCLLAPYGRPRAGAGDGAGRDHGGRPGAVGARRPPSGGGHRHVDAGVGWLFDDADVRGPRHKARPGGGAAVRGGGAGCGVRVNRARGHSKPSSTRPIPGKSAVSRSPASAG